MGGGRVLTIVLQQRFECLGPNGAQEQLRDAGVKSHHQRIRSNLRVDRVRA